MVEYKTGSMMNPYLASLVKKTREQVSDESLRDEYATETRKAAAKGRSLSWDEFLGERALREAIEENPVLRMRRVNFPLPEDVLDGLYWLRVDVLADLLQITKDELKRFAKQERLKIRKINSFLDSIGIKLYSSKDENSWKFPALRIIDPGKAARWQIWDFTSYEGHKLHLARPSLVMDWFEEYYRRYEYCRYEENLRTEWLEIKPELENGSFPSAMQEFFIDTRDFFTAYRIACLNNGIPILVPTPMVPLTPDELVYFSNERYLSVKKDVVRAVISVLENSDLLGMPAFCFLRADDDKKLDISGQITGDESFRLMLIQYVGLRVDMENVVDYFKSLTDWVDPPEEDLEDDMEEPATKKPDPINPWLAELILKYRKENPDDTIRESYRHFSELRPDKSWEDYLSEQALFHESRLNPIIVNRLDECDLPEVITDYLSTSCDADIVADLLQITIEEMMQLFEGKLWQVNILEGFLQKNGLKFYSCPINTYKISFPLYLQYL